MTESNDGICNCEHGCSYVDLPEGSVLEVMNTTRGLAVWLLPVSGADDVLAEVEF